MIGINFKQIFMKNTKNILANQKGFTLVSMVLSLVLLGIMGFAASELMFQNVTAYNTINNSEALMAHSDQAIYVLKKDLADVNSFNRVSANRIRYTDSGGNLVEFIYSNGQVVRRVVDGLAGWYQDGDDWKYRLSDSFASSDTLLNQISTFGFRFYDRNNVQINFAGTLSSPGDNATLSTITRIEVNLNLDDGKLNQVFSIIPNGILYPDIVQN